MKFGEDNKYLINGHAFIYDGIWQGHTCDRCGKARECLYAFIQGERTNPTQIAKYGSECIKHIDIVSLSNLVGERSRRWH